MVGLGNSKKSVLKHLTEKPTCRNFEILSTILFNIVHPVGATG